jgi:hypothetical protein
VLRAGRLSEGFVVEASLLARLLRLKLLHVEATVLVGPAGIARPSTLPHGADGALAQPAGGVPAGRRLVDARRFLDEGEALLAQARRSASVLQDGHGRPSG